MNERVVIIRVNTKQFNPSLLSELPAPDEMMTLAQAQNAIEKVTKALLPTSNDPNSAEARKQADFYAVASIVKSRGEEGAIDIAYADTFEGNEKVITKTFSEWSNLLFLAKVRNLKKK